MASDDGTTNADLQQLLRSSRAKVEAMSPDEYEAMLKAQWESSVRGEMGWGKPRYCWVNGVKVYESYEDYCSD